MEGGEKNNPNMQAFMLTSITSLKHLACKGALCKCHKHLFTMLDTFLISVSF